MMYPFSLCRLRLLALALAVIVVGPVLCTACGTDEERDVPDGESDGDVDAADDDAADGEVLDVDDGASGDAADAADTSDDNDVGKADIDPCQGVTWESYGDLCTPPEDQATIRCEVEPDICWDGSQEARWCDCYSSVGGVTRWQCQLNTCEEPPPP